MAKKRQKIKTRRGRKQHRDEIFAAQLEILGYSEEEIREALREWRESEGRDLADPPDVSSQLNH